MTATPRYYTGRITRAAAEADFEVSSMDDEARFGKVFHRLGFSEAIQRDLLTDYQVVVVGVDDATYLQWAERGTLVTRDGKNIADARSLAGQIGLAKAMRKYDLRRVISFHSRVNQAREFATELPEVINWMPARQRPKGQLWARPATGEMSAGQRHILLQHLTQLDNGERGLLTNARCLAEGVDVPALDGVAFIDPRRSEVDIVQAVGRAIRKSEDKTVGTIVIPVFIDTDADPQKALDDSVFKPVWDVVKALRAHDDALAEQIDSLRRKMGGRSGSAKLPDKIKLDIPVTVDAAFADAFDTRLVEQTSTSWEFWFGLLERYVAEHGTAGIRDDHVADDGYRLGKWVGKQRSKWEELPDSRKQRLQELPGWTLDARVTLWEASIAALTHYVEENGHANPPRGLIVDGIDLESWVRRQRQTWDQLADERRRRLQTLPGWTLNVLDGKWDTAYRYLLKYVEENGTAQVKQSYITDDGYRLGKWVSVQRRIWDKLSGDRRQRLQALPCWTLNARGDWWEGWFGHLQQYVAEHGNARVPQAYVTPDGAKLGSWVANQKSTHKQLSAERRQRLEQLPGWTFDSHTAYWEDGLQYLTEYAEKHGAARPPSNYVIDGFKLGIWVNTQRQNWDTLGEDKRHRLEALPGWVLNTKVALWEEGFGYLLRYVDEQGTALVPVYCIFDGFKLGQWVGVQRAGWKTLKRERRERLAALPGWAVSIRDAWWEEGFRQIQLYVKETGHACPPQKYVTVDGFRLGSWVTTQRGALLRGKMSPERQRRLEALLGWDWVPRTGSRGR